MPPLRLPNPAWLRSRRSFFVSPTLTPIHDPRRWPPGRPSPTTAPSAGLRAVAAEPAARLSVWTFNLRTSFCEEQDGDDGWSHRRSGVARLLQRHRPAVVAAQEATLPMIEYLVEQTGYEWHGQCRSGDHSDEHSALLWDPARLRLLQGETRWLAPRPESAGIGWDAAFNRIYTRGLFELCDSPSATQLVIVCTHFDHVGTVARVRSAEALRRLLQPGDSDAWDVSATTPTILCGDFNSVKLPLAEGAGAPGPFAALTEGHGGWKDAWALAAQRELNGLAPSASTIHKFRGLAFEDGFGDGTVTFSAREADTPDGAQHIDWILVAEPEDHPVRLRPMTAAVITEALETGRFPSDHFPVAVEFSVVAQEEKSILGKAMMMLGM